MLKKWIKTNPSKHGVFSLTLSMSMKEEHLIVIVFQSFTVYTVNPQSDEENYHRKGSEKLWGKTRSNASYDLWLIWRTDKTPTPARTFWINKDCKAKKCHAPKLVIIVGCFPSTSHRLTVLSLTHTHSHTMDGTPYSSCKLSGWCDVRCIFALTIREMLSAWLTWKLHPRLHVNVAQKRARVCSRAGRFSGPVKICRYNVCNVQLRFMASH